MQLLTLLLKNVLLETMYIRTPQILDLVIYILNNEDIKNAEGLITDIPFL